MPKSRRWRHRSMHSILPRQKHSKQKIVVDENVSSCTIVCYGMSRHMYIYIYKYTAEKHD